MPPTLNVVRLDSYRPSDDNVTLRQTAVREDVQARLEGDGASVAYAGISVDPDGNITTAACLIEPEHVPAVVEELSGLIARLMKFMRSERAMAAAGAYIALFIVDLQLVPVLASSL